MAEGRGKAEWGRMSVLLALLANINRDPKRSRTLTPKDFNPYYAKKERRIENFGSLKELFVPSENANEKVVAMDHNSAGDAVANDGVGITTSGTEAGSQ